MSVLDISASGRPAGITTEIVRAVGRHRFLDAIEERHLPRRCAQQKRAQLRAYKVGNTLGSILRARY